MIEEPILDVAIRIRFAGSKVANNYHISPEEGKRFYTDWDIYLKGGVLIGGTYTLEESGQSVTISFNFNQIAYIENGKVY
jgi:hypothetical protein